MRFLQTPSCTLNKLHNAFQWPGSNCYATICMTYGSFNCRTHLLIRGLQQLLAADLQLPELILTMIDLYQHHFKYMFVA